METLISKLFSLFSPYKFPVQSFAANRQKRPKVRYIATKATAGHGPIARISLHFSLLAGNLRRRLVRDGLGRQPASKYLIYWLFCHLT